MPNYAPSSGYPVYRSSQTTSRGSGNSSRNPSQALARQTFRSRTMGFGPDTVDILWDWGKNSRRRDNIYPTDYFDYFFTGQDIQVNIDGLEIPQFDLPIANFAYNIEQQKQPLYGYWSYTYDYMMKGVRLVTGAFSVFTVRADYMLSILEAAAEARVDRMTTYPIRDLDEDEANIEKYWGTNPNFDNNMTFAERNPFHQHPPFDLVITYGIQNVSIADNYNDRAADIRQRYMETTALMADYNERLVESDVDLQRQRIVLQDIEINREQREFTPDGSLLGEIYSFTARDVKYRPVPSGTTASGTGTSTAS